MKNKQALLYVSLLMLSSTLVNAAEGPYGNEEDGDFLGDLEPFLMRIMNKDLDKQWN